MEKQYNDIEKIIKDAGVEVPSPNFLNNVMNQIEVVSEQKEVGYQPLISKRSWGLIGVVVLGIIVLMAILPDTGTSIFDKMNFSFFDISKSLNNPLSGITIYRTAVYGLLFLGILFFVQISFLKRRIDNTQ